MDVHINSGPGTSPEVWSALRDQFESMYPFERVACINLDASHLDNTLIIRFQRDPFGRFLVVRRGSDFQAFPWFKQDLVGERTAIEGVFAYPVYANVAVAVPSSHPAILKPRGDEWIQMSSGILEVDDGQTGSFRPRTGGGF